MELALLIAIFIGAFIFCVYVKVQQYKYEQAKLREKKQRKVRTRQLVVYVDSETGEVVGTGKEEA